MRKGRGEIFMKYQEYPVEILNRAEAKFSRFRGGDLILVSSAVL